MKTTVVIPNMNGKDYLKNCLDSLKKSTVSHKVIVVDNGSQDGSFEMVFESYPEVELIPFSENTGFCKAVNTGIKAAQTEYVLLLNNDTQVTPGMIEILERMLDKNEKFFSVSAKMLSLHDKNVIDDAGNLYCSLGWAFALGKGKSADQYNRSSFIFAACAGAALYRKSIFEEIGYFDENHFAYLEDIDIGYRARICGYKNLCNAKAICYHAGSASSGSRYNPFKTRYSARNNVYLIWKNMPTAQIILNAPLLAVGFLTKIVFFIKKGMGREYIEALQEGIAMCKNPDNAGKRVVYDEKNLRNYIVIQLELWLNTIRRLVG